MATLVHDGLILPIHRKEDVLFKEDDYRRIATTSAERFARIARPWGHNPDLSLAARLRHTDRALNIIAEYCGIRVVEHNWGVCPEDPEMFKEYPRGDAEGLLPAGFLLVADVATIAPCPEDGSFEAVYAKLQDYKIIDLLIAESGVDTLFTDYGGKPEQIVFGSPVKHPGLNPAWYYCDIDPILDAPSEEEHFTNIGNGPKFAGNIAK